MKLRNSYRLLILGMLCWHTIGFAQQPKLKFKRISIEQGLSNSTIETIYQDSRGFIWFGTRDGLNRYDGNQVTVYRYDAKDSNSISDNFIRCIYEDRNHALWIGTINGLNRFNTATNTFTRYKQSRENAGSLSNNFVTSVLQDAKGDLWVGTQGGGINLFLPAKNAFAHFRHGEGKAKTLSSDRVNYLMEDSRSNLWVATDNGLNLFNREARSFKLFSGENGSGQQNIRIIKEDPMGNLWLGTEDNGLVVFNYKDTVFKYYQHHQQDPNSLASNQVRTILVDKNRDIWIGAINGGLDLFNPATGGFFHYQNEPDNAFSLSQRTVSALYQDNQDNMWVGTHRGGVNIYSPNTGKFSLYRQEAFINSLSYNDVKAFCEDKNGNIWIGTDGGGLDMYDRNTHNFTHFKYSAFDANSLSSNEVLVVTEDSEGNLWIATWGGGVSVYNRGTGKFTRYLHSPSNPNAISSNYVQKVFEDSKKNLWVATYYGGLNRFDKKTKTFSRVGGDMANRIQGNNIVSISEDRQGNLWLGTDDGGLNCYNAATGKCTHYFNTAEKMPDLRVIFFDSKNRLWIGQNGLYLFDSAKNQFNLFTDVASLNTAFIKGIAEDDQGNFWISTSGGLTRFNPQSFSFKKYNPADGLQGLEFEANAYLKTRDGQMFFGGVNGFNAFYPENIKTNSFIPPVYITDFNLFNKKVQPGAEDGLLENDISLSNEINLSYQQSTFSFGFAALNYTALENNQYAYKLEPWDKDWNDAGSDRKASYTNVAPGHYTFRVKASNNDGIWNEKGAAIKVTIRPPFWNTWWFRTLAAIIIISGLVWFYRFKRRLERQKLEEEKKDEIHQVQLQFFTNISHEFRTPLSLILGPLEQLQKEDPQSGFTHYYQVMYRNANRLMNLINELMDFRKAESGVLKLHVMPGNLQLFLQEISEEFSELALQRKIQFSVAVSEAINDPWFDRQVLEKIVINLLSNAFKYSGDKATIVVEVLDTMEHFKPNFANELVLKNGYQAKKTIYLRVADTGIGISKESIVHLFERYYKITETHLGSGIGLAFVKSLATLHKGDIYVYSEREKGTEIIIAIPVHKEDYTKEEKWVKSHPEGGARLESIHAKYEHLDTTATEDVETEIPETETVGRPHVLIVDDNKELRTFLKESLQHQYQIIEAADGFEGIAMAKEHYPDIIISDVMMPGMDGIEFCKRIKEDIETSHIPFVMLTAKDALESRIEGTASGADFYFSKPLSMELLNLTLRNTLQQKQKLKDHYFTDQHADAKDLVHSTKDKAFLDELITIIEAQLTNPDMDVDYICTRIGMSKTSLYQKIKKLTGQSIGEFIRTVRFKKAVQIMTHEDVSLSEVMYSVGIQTQSYFTKAFKKEFGKTPSQFLKDLAK
ncbi:MAG: two-component regulator propeller domain-containing protein [Bacteroidota bacterium]